MSGKQKFKQEKFHTHSNAKEIKSEKYQRVQETSREEKVFSQLIQPLGRIT